MHKESYNIMEYFVEKYLDKTKKLNILDVGSQDINGTYKGLFNHWNYTGLDMVEGNNVDIVSKGTYEFGLKKKYDIVISGNCMEHVEAPWLWIKEIEKATKKGGIVCIIVPFSIKMHRYPLDCWRVLPDGLRYLMGDHCNFEILECDLHGRIRKNEIQDTFCIARK